ncbi:MAG: hypothetical protein AAGD96_35565 [Chloroflexota bacterium]
MSKLLSELPNSVIAATLGLFFLLLCAGGATVTLLLAGQQHDYPFGEIVEDTGRCGSTEYFQRGRSVRVERYRCVLTKDNANEIFVWYIKQGYTPRNGGLVLESYQDQIIPVLQIERIYTIDQKDGTTMIRIYDDTTVRAP